MNLRLKKSGSKRKINYQAIIDVMSSKKESEIDCWIALHNELRTTESSKVKYLIKAIYSNEKTKMLFDFKTNSKNKLITHRIPKKTSIHTEIELIIINITENKELLSDFLRLRDLYERAYIIGEIEKANVILNEIEDKFGHSFWLYENRICLLLDRNEVEKAKNVKNEYNSSAAFQNVITGAIFGKLSTNDSKAFNNTYIDGILKGLSNQELNIFGELFSLLSLPIEQCSISNHEIILILIRKFSTIDRYILTKKVTKNFFHHLDLSNDLDINKSFHYLCEEISLIIEDEWDLITNKRSFEHACLNLKDIIKEYTIGSYDKAINICISKLIENPTDLTCSEILIKSHIYLDKPLLIDRIWPVDSIINRFLNCIYEITRVNTRISEKENEIETILIKHSNLEFTTSGKSSYLSIHPLHHQSELKSSLKYLLLSKNSMSPRQYNICSKDLIQSYISYEDSLKYFEKKDTGDYLIPEERIQRYEILKEVQNTKTPNEKLESRILQLISNHKNTIPGELENILFKYYINTDQVQQSSRILVESFISNIEKHRCFDIKYLANKIIENYKSIDLSRPEYCLTLYIYSRFISKNHDEYLADAFEDYFDENGVERPSDLLKGKKEIDKLEHYLFKNVCMISMMDNLTTFKSSDELKSERIKIIDLIIKNSNAEIIELNLEKEKILDDIIIKKSVKELETNKLYVDIEQLRNARANDYISLYNLYIESKAINQTSTAINEINNNESNEHNEHNEKIFEVLHNNKNVILDRIISNIVQDFVFNLDYGLNRYVGSEIRHGIFENQLRSCVEKYKLVTDRKANCEYADNLHWQEKNFIIDENCINDIQEKLKEFSHDFDKLIIGVNNRYNVTDSKDSNNFFNYYINTDHKKQLEIVLDLSISFEGFFEELMKFMWSVTERNVGKIRKHLNEEFRETALKLFDDLNVKLEESSYSAFLVELKENVQEARNSLLENINIIYDWFKVRESIYINSLSLEHTIEVGIESYRVLCKPKNLNIDYNKKDTCRTTILNHCQVRNLVLSLINAFNNSLKYGSNLTGHDLIISVLTTNNSFEINIQNFVTGEHLDYLVNGGLDSVKKIISTIDSRKAMASDGGSGLGKIKYLMSEAFESLSINIELNQTNFFLKLNVNI